MQVCTSLQTDNHASTSPLSFFTGRMPFLPHNQQSQSTEGNHFVHTRAHTHTFNGLFSGTTQVSQYQKGKTNLDFTEARDSEWQWHQLGHMQVCALLQTQPHQHPTTLFFTCRMPFLPPTNSVKALKALICYKIGRVNSYVLDEIEWCSLKIVKMVVVF